MKISYDLPTGLLVALIILEACNTAPAPAGPSSVETSALDPAPEVDTDAPPFKVGEVTDFSGIYGRSFHPAPIEGLEDDSSLPAIEISRFESVQQSDHLPNIQQVLSEDPDLIILFGSLLGLDTAAAAKADPGRKFAIVDYAYPDCPPDGIEGQTCGSASELSNVRGLTFRVDQAAFLAGYLAAGITGTGRVGTYGGEDIPSVTIYMKGFEAGVDYYNRMHATSVEVKGGLSEAGGGLFTGNFDSLEDARAYTQGLLLAGVDIVLPVAGPAGLGSAAVCEETGQCLIIGVETDWFMLAPEYGEFLLTSVIKRIDLAVQQTIQAAMQGRFTGGTVVYTIKDGAVDLAPFHDLDERIPLSLKSEIERLKMLLSAGTLTIDDIPDVEQ